MPIRRIACHVAFAAVLVTTGAARAPAQQDPGVNVQTAPRDRVPPPRTGTAVVKGRVVDGTTGAGVARARVTVQGGARVSVRTDAGGAFAFTNLPPGPVRLMADKATYLQSRYPSGGRTIRSNFRPVTVLDGQTLDNITIPLFHGGAIMGRVVDANGDPLDNAEVSVLRMSGPGRAGRTAIGAGASTDDRGEFRIGRLDAGTYVVQVTARRDPGFDDRMPDPAPEPVPLPTYYPAASSIDQAQPITLERGQTVTDVDVILGEGFPGVINGTVSTANGPLAAGANGHISVRRISKGAGPGSDRFSGGTGLRPDGSFKLTLAPGEYQLEARLMPGPGPGPRREEDEQLAILKVTVVAGAEESVAMVAGPGASVTGRVIFEGETPPLANPGMNHVPMFSEHGTCRSGEAAIAPDWSFSVKGLFGTCDSPPIPVFGRWVLKAVLVDGRDISDSPVTFEPGQHLRNVQVVVTDRRSQLSFRVSDDTGQPTREYVVVVYPVDKTRWSRARIFAGPPPLPVDGRAVQTAASAPGPSRVVPRREEMTGLRPGEYYAVAVDDLEPDDFRDPAVLDRMRSSAVRVTVVEGSVDVPLRRFRFAELMSRR
jgi:hypothetical protein